VIRNRNSVDMLLCIQPLLDDPALAEVRQAAASLQFVDGARTAGWHARLVKHNEQAAEDPGMTVLREAITTRLRANRLFAMAARPRRFGPVLVSRYRPGMTYGSHVDDAIMGEVRVDIAFTLFLSDVASYEGGELVIESSAGEQAIRLDAGGVVLYPATSLHRVQPVAMGERLAVVGWLQSLVRDPARRELLFDLDTARQQMFARDGKTAAFDLVSKSLANLLRQWSET
jgi:PKHD-type hydroxylase